MPWSLTVRRNGIYTWKWSRGPGLGLPGVGAREEGGGRLYLHRSGPNGLFLALGRLGRRYLQEESSMA